MLMILLVNTDATKGAPLGNISKAPEAASDIR